LTSGQISYKEIQCGKFGALPVPVGTFIVISCRLWIAGDEDRTAVPEGGSNAACGSHRELLEKTGK